MNKILSLTTNCISINIAQDSVLSHIRSEFLPEKKQKVMMQSGGSISNNGMKKKSMPPAKKSLAQPISQKNRINQNKYNKKNHHNNRRV